MDKCKVCGKDTITGVTLSLGVEKCDKCGNEKSVTKTVPLCPDHVKAFAENGPGILAAAL